MRIDLICDCGNRDDMDVEDGETTHWPPCSAECGRTMRRATLADLVLLYTSTLSTDLTKLTPAEREADAVKVAAAYRAMVDAAKAVQ